MAATSVLRRDEDVLDTWFSSALWPFSTLGWPDETPELRRYYPTSTLVTGFDIIFFWVARMMMMGLHFMDEVPFDDRLHPRPRARREGGQDVEVERQRHRSAATHRPVWRRCAALHAWPPWRRRAATSSSRSQRVEGNRNFATKIWNAARFAEMNGCVRVAGFDPRGVRETLNLWALGECAKAVAEVTAGDRGLQVQRGGARRLSLRLERLLRLDPRTREARAAGARRSREGGDPRDHRLYLRRDLQAAAPVHAVPHGGAVGDQGRGRPAARERSCAGTMATARRPCETRMPRRKSAGSSTSSRRVRSARSETNVAGRRPDPARARRALR